MAKMKKASRPELISGGYSAIPWTVLDSISFMGASDKAKALLLALMRQHGGNNNGHLHLARKWLYNGWRRMGILGFSLCNRAFCNPDY